MGISLHTWKLEPKPQLSGMSFVYSHRASRTNDILKTKPEIRDAYHISPSYFPVLCNTAPRATCLRCHCSLHWFLRGDYGASRSVIQLGYGRLLRAPSDDRHASEPGACPGVMASGSMITRFDRDIARNSASILPARARTATVRTQGARHRQWVTIMFLNMSGDLHIDVQDRLPAGKV